MPQPLRSAGAFLGNAGRRMVRRVDDSPLMNHPMVFVGAWFITRLTVLLIWAIFYVTSKGDVTYYYNEISQMQQVGAAGTLVEYPTPVIWIMLIPWYLGAKTLTGYVFVFVTIMLALDAGFSLTLWRFGGRLRGVATGFWILFVLLLGPTAFLRFDMVTSVLSGWALILLLRRRPVWGGALIGIGAAVKLWPALLWPALCGGSRRHNAKATLGTAGAGVVLAVASLIYAGWDRLLSPLSWQSGRGLQVESLWASVPMVLRAFGIGSHAVAMSRFQAFEIWGTAVHPCLIAANVASLAGYAFLVIVFVAWWIRGAGRLMEACVLMTLVVTVLIAVNKTFSPQYTLWLAGPLAAGFVVMGARVRDNRYYAADRRRLIQAGAVALVMELLTFIEFPLYYGELVRDLTGWQGAMRVPITIVLEVRNLLLVALLVFLIRWAWSFLNPTAFRAARQNRPAEEPSGVFTGLLVRTWGRLPRHASRPTRNRFPD